MLVIGQRTDAHPELQEAIGWIGSRVDDVYGTTIGTVADVWVDDGTRRPRWLLLQGGRFGGRFTLVPYADASGGSADVWIPYDWATVRAAPKVSPSQPLSGKLDAKFEAHYRTARAAATPAPPPLPARGRPDHAHRLG
jgi:sporulation protein YlmC with PRC-barrel domain